MSGVMIVSLFFLVALGAFPFELFSVAKNRV